MCKIHQVGDEGRNRDKSASSLEDCNTKVIINPTIYSYISTNLILFNLVRHQKKNLKEALNIG